MKKVQIKEIKNGEFIRRQPDSKTTYIKGDYDRTNKKYSCINFDDINKEIFIKSTAKVWVGFTF